MKEGRRGKQKNLVRVTFDKQKSQRKTEKKKKKNDERGREKDERKRKGEHENRGDKMTMVEL